jgi:hypothetical protein
MVCFKGMEINFIPLQNPPCIFLKIMQLIDILKIF